MAKPRYYSPRIEQGLISPLYFEAKRRQVPMTELASQFVIEGLRRTRDQATASEDPVAPDLRDRADQPDH